MILLQIRCKFLCSCPDSPAYFFIGDLPVPSSALFNNCLRVAAVHTGKSYAWPILGFYAMAGQLGLVKLSAMAAPTTTLLALFLFFAGLEMDKSKSPTCAVEPTGNDKLCKGQFGVTIPACMQEKPSEKCIFPIREIKQDSILWQRFS
jgi:hypothetical protein